MRRWSEVAERVAATTRTSEKTRLLAEYLASLARDALPPATVFFAGRPFAEADGRTVGLGWATLADSMTRVTGASRAELGAAYDRYSDLGRAVGDVLAARPAAGALGMPPTLAEVASTFAEIEAARGAAAKASAFESLLRRCDPLTATYVVKILAGELRIGLRDGLVEAAIARAFGQSPADVARAAMLTGDLGETAALARDGSLAGARLRLFHPLRFMLASPVADAAEIVGRMGQETWTEDKYDGIRAQLHRRGDQARLFSRDLRDVSGQFPEIVEVARDLRWDGILDGELLAIAEGTALPFLALQKRLGRKAPGPALLAEVPVIFVAFDVLALGPRGGEVVALLERPLHERRASLEGLDLERATGGRLVPSRLARARYVDEIEQAFEAARGRRNEGLMVKDPASAYTPGRRGYGWLKLKKALATLDCVVVGVEAGHGKRHGVLSDYTFAVRDEASGGLATIGKAYTGLTDAELAELSRWFETHTLSRHGRYRLVEPGVVVEVAFDVIMRSARHASGFALRFPRIARVRDDKTVDEIDTLATVERLWRELQAGAELLVTQAAARSPAVPSVPPTPSGTNPEQAAGDAAGAAPPRE